MESNTETNFSKSEKMEILSAYLKSKGINTKIVKKKKGEELTEDEKKENEKFLQTLVNSFSDLKKLDLTLDCGKRNALILEYGSEIQKEFTEELSKNLSKHFSINENDIEIRPPINLGTTLVKNIKFSVIFKTDIPKEKSNKDSLKNGLKMNDTKILDIQSNFLLDTVNINKGLLNFYGDVTNNDYGVGEERGGKQYYPPIGWAAIGLDVKGRFDDGNDSWIGFIDGDEWCIAYYGASQPKGADINKLKKSNDINHYGEVVGEGVYCTPKPEIMEKEAKVIDLNGKKYKIGFMLRIFPDKIRIPEGNMDYWFVEGNTSEIRPYRILLKEDK